MLPLSEEGPAPSGPRFAGDRGRERQSDALRTTQRLVRLRRVVPPGMLPLSGEGPAPSGPRFAGDRGRGGQSVADDTEACAPSARRPSRNAASQRGGTGSVRSAVCWRSRERKAKRCGRHRGRPSLISRARPTSGFHLGAATVLDPRPIPPGPDYCERNSILKHSFRGSEVGCPRNHAATV